MLTCQQFVERVNLHLDGSLEGPAEEELRAHADICEGCRRHLAQSRALLRATRQVGRRPVPVAISPELIAALARRRAVSPRRSWAWLWMTVVALATGVAGWMALNPEASPPEVGAHLPCTLVVLVAAWLPVGSVWAGLRRRGRTLTVSAAAALAAAGAFGGQLVSGLGCPDAHLQRHLLLSHFGALVVGTLVASAWARWAPRPRADMFVA